MTQDGRVEPVTCLAVGPFPASPHGSRLQWGWGAVLSVQRSGSCLGPRPHLVGRLRTLCPGRDQGAPGPRPLPHTPSPPPPSKHSCVQPGLCFFNGGHCVSGSAQPCRCPPGFQGPRCQHGEWCPLQVPMPRSL